MSRVPSASRKLNINLGTKYLSILGKLIGIKNLSRILAYIIEHHSKSHK